MSPSFLPDTPLSPAQLQAAASVLQQEVTHWFRAQLPEGCASDAEDLWQDAIVRLLNRREPVIWLGSREFRALVYRIAHGLRSEWWGNANRHPRHQALPEAAGSSNAAPDPPASAEPISGPMRRRERIARLLELMRAHLSADEILILQLHYGEELPWDRVAAQVGVNAATVRQQACRAMQTLRDNLPYSDFANP